MTPTAHRPPFPVFRAALPREGKGAVWALYQGMVSVMVLTFVWRMQEVFPILQPIHLTELASVAAIALYLVTGGPDRTLRAVRHPIARWMGAILLLSMLSVPGGVFPGHSFRFLVEDHLKTIVLVVVLAAAIRDSGDAARFAGVHVLGGIVYCWAVLVRFDVQADGRLAGLYFYDANDLGLLLVCTLPLALFFLQRRTHALWRAGILLAGALFVLALLKTGSRGGFLGLVVALGYLLFGSRVVPRRARIPAVVGAVAVLIALAGDGYWTKMSTLLNPTQDYNWSGKSESGRMEVWKRGLGYMADRPLLGVGVNAFYAAEGALSPLAKTQFYGRGFKWSAPHNSFVQIAAELGVFGIASFLGLLWSAFRAARRIGTPPGGAGPSERSSAVLGHALATAMVGFAVTGFFLSQAYSAYGYSLFAILIGLGSVLTPRPLRDPVPPTPPRRRAALVPGGLYPHPTWETPMEPNR